MQDRNEEIKKEGSSENKNANAGDTSIHGRVDHTANPEFKEKEMEADISQVDRQEGTMHNGELGGNFDDEKNRGS